jgi:hypothetical protein
MVDSRITTSKSYSHSNLFQDRFNPLSLIQPAQPASIMYFLNPFSIVLLASAATVSAAPYTNANIHVRALNSTAPYTKATIAAAPLVTPAVRRNIIPLYRRRAQAPATR